ncbi:MAG: hypothetical protein QOD06_2891 [Candidatus Binatota bacterium]|nr:hypothetical protein [Candidatus Binatota bacterium]
MIRRPILFVLTALGCNLGCSPGGPAGQVAYSPPPPPATSPADERIAVSAPFERAWAGVVRALFEKNVPIRTIEKASGIIETGEVKGEIGVDCDCGSYLGIPVGGYGAYGGDALYAFRILVEAEGDTQTMITLRSSCRGVSESVPQLRCVVRPEKEKQFRGELETRVRAATPPAAS